MGIRCRIRGGISARPAGCTDENLHQFALLKKRARMTANVQILWGEHSGDPDQPFQAIPITIPINPDQYGAVC
jgi:hypothetical protein